MNYLATGTPPGRTGNYHPNLTPYQVFDCSDGHIIIATGNDGQYQRLCQILGLDDMADELITYCETRLLFDELLAEVKHFQQVAGEQDLPVQAVTFILDARGGIDGVTVENDISF